MLTLVYHGFIHIYLYLSIVMSTGCWFKPIQTKILVNQSIGMIIPNIWKNEKMFQIINQIDSYSFWAASACLSVVQQTWPRSRSQLLPKLQELFCRVKTGKSHRIPVRRAIKNTIAYSNCNYIGNIVISHHRMYSYDIKSYDCAYVTYLQQLSFVIVWQKMVK